MLEMRISLITATNNSARSVRFAQCTHTHAHTLLLHVYHSGSVVHMVAIRKIFMPREVKLGERRERVCRSVMPCARHNNRTYESDIHMGEGKRERDTARARELYPAGARTHTHTRTRAFERLAAFATLL